MAIYQPLSLKSLKERHFLFFQSWRKESAFSYLIGGSGAEIYPFFLFSNIILPTNYSTKQEMAISQPVSFK
jgi:hypothetical protein